MAVGLREQALQRARSMTSARIPMQTQPVIPTVQNTSAITSPSPAQKPHTAQSPLTALIQTLGLDSDQLILLVLLIVLYYDHASPKLLLAVLYLML